ncbi:MAG: DUF4129 domain-containing protein [Conexivisphaerales archaeon]
MKKILSVFCLLLLFLGQSLALAAGGIPRQVDPSTIQEQSPYPVSLLQFYEGITKLVGSGNFSSAIAQLNSSGLIHVPSQLQFIYSRFNSLLSQATSELEQVNSSISLATQELINGNLTSANSTLSEGYYELSLANVTLSELGSAAIQMESNFGLPSGQLQNQVNQLVLVEGNYKKNLDSLRSRLNNLITGIETDRAFSTVLTVSSSAQQAYLGSNITLYGQLVTSRNFPLANRTVQISSSTMSSPLYAITDAQGKFSVSLQLPYVYVAQATFYARFIPQGNDSAIYLGSSAAVTLKLLFYQPTILLNSPGQALPGSTIMVNGTFISNQTSSAEITISAFGSAQRLNAVNGTFSASISVPVQTADGYYAIIASSQPEKLVAPADYSSQILVRRIEANLSANLPAFVFGGETITIAGRAVAANGTALSGSSVTSVLANTVSSTSVQKDGTFVMTLFVPLLVTTGNSKISLDLQPGQSWVEAASIQKNIIAISPVAVIVPLLIVLIGILLFARQRNVVQAVIETIQKRAAAREEPRVHIVASDVVNAYNLLLQKLSTRGLAIKANETLREYLRRIAGNFPDLADDFAFLTRVVEEEIYGFGATEEDKHAAKLTAQKLLSTFNQ